jgi:hypothetical protein
MESIFRDVRYGLRSLIKSPGLTIVVTIALTLGAAAHARADRGVLLGHRQRER